VVRSRAPVATGSLARTSPLPVPAMGMVTPPVGLPGPSGRPSSADLPALGDLPVT